MASLTFIDGQTLIPASWYQPVNDFVYGGITPPGFTVSIASGGTGATTASQARVNLGLEIGVNVQAYSAFLTSLIALADGIVAKSSGVAVARTITGTTNKITVTNGDGVAGNPTITVGSDILQTTAIGTTVQAYSAQLTSAAGVGDGIIAHTAANTFTPRTLTGTSNRISITNGTGVSGNPTFDVGSDVYTVGGTDVAVTDGGTGASTAANARTNLGVLSFSTISVAGQSDVVADSSLDTLTLAAGSNVTITTNAGTDTITIAASGGGGGTPGGSAGQMQYNSAGTSFGGDTGLSTDGAGTLTLTGTINGTSIPTSKTLTVTTNNLSVFASTTSAQLAGVLSDETGTGVAVFNNTPTFITPILGTPTSGTLTNCTLPVGGITGMGTGVGTFLVTPSSANLASAVTDETGSGALVFATSPTFVTPILGTPTSGTLTNCTLPVGGITGMGTGVGTFLVTPSSANLAAALTDETGSGAAVFATSPTLVTPILGTPTSGTLTNCTLPVGGVTGMGTGVGTFLATPSSANLATAVTDETGSGALVFATSPTLVTPLLGTPTSGTLTNCTGLPVAGGGTGVATMTTAYAPVCAGTTATGALQVASSGLSTSGRVLTSTGSSSLPTWQAAPGGGLTLVANATASSSTSLDFATAFSSTYKTFIIVANNLLPVTDAVDAWLRVSTDSSTFLSTSTYKYTQIIRPLDGSGTATSAVSSGAAQILLNSSTVSIGNSAEGISFALMFFDPSAGSRITSMSAMAGMYYSTTTVPQAYDAFDGVNTTTSALTGFQFKFSSGNVSTGTIKVYGMQAT